MRVARQHSFDSGAALLNCSKLYDSCRHADAYCGPSLEELPFLYHFCLRLAPLPQPPSSISNSIAPSPEPFYFMNGHFPEDQPHEWSDVANLAEGLHVSADDPPQGP